MSAERWGGGVKLSLEQRSRHDICPSKSNSIIEHWPEKINFGLLPQFFSDSTKSKLKNLNPNKLEKFSMILAITQDRMPCKPSLIGMSYLRCRLGDGAEVIPQLTEPVCSGGASPGTASVPQYVGRPLSERGRTTGALWLAPQMDTGGADTRSKQTALLARPVRRCAAGRQGCSSSVYEALPARRHVSARPV